MNKIWEFFENMNEFLYVSDMDTYEIVYMNKKSLDVFGISSIDEIKNYMPDNQSIGIIYCDITGLKQVNDTEGHAAGDKLILDACACMKRVFKHNTLFRIGGDEFLYLCPNITEDKLKQLEQKLKDDISKHSVNMAIGRCWCENSSHNLDKAISQAEKAMYQDKLDYYDKQGR